ncbi:MAG: RNA methyltransferase [Rhodospirillales bacterium]
MAKTTTRRPAKSQAAAAGQGGPAVILIEPQLPENIGMAARSMLNCGLGDLRLVNPRDGWPNDKALAPSAGAGVVLEKARVFASTAQAVADLQLVHAATARERHMTKEVLTPEKAALEMRTLTAAGGRAGIMFGRESKGLDNDDVALADAIISFPINPAFCSLNLAQAVLLAGYEWLKAAGQTPKSGLTMPKNTRPANKAEMVGLFEHLERELDDCGFLHVAEKRPIMVQNIRNMLGRAVLTEQEVRTLRGIITGLVSGKRG